jgi:signal transduction histidine kinase
MKQTVSNGVEKRLRQPRSTTFIHDLRQCVATGLLLSEEVRGTEGPESEAQIRLTTLHRLFEQMRNLIDTEVDDSGTRWTKLDLPGIVGECVRLAPTAPRLEIDASLPSSAAAYGDPVLLHRAISNILDNAARAAGPAGRIRVIVREIGDESIVEVTDDGVGFGRASYGTGQGMTVIASAVRACRGRLEILSGPEPGTTVRLVLPKHAVAS